MLDDVDPLRGILEFTQKCYSIFCGILEILRHSSQVGSTFGNSSELIIESEDYPLAVMASVDPIDISSSDSDSDLREIDNYRDESPVRDTAASASSRVLPPWASSIPNLTGYNNISWNAPSSKISDEISLKPHKHLHTAETAGPSSLNLARDPNNRGSFGINPEVPSSRQALKRALPATFQPSTSSARSNNLVENAIPETYAKVNQSAWSNFSNGKNSDNFTGVNLSESPLYENRGNRLLPSSLFLGKSALTNPYAGSNDSLHHPVVGEEKTTDADERLIFQAALKDLHQPKTEANLPDGILTVSLLRHQKIALAWMLQKESSTNCLGGILADDQGLGKTVSMIALIQMQKLLEAKSKPEDSCEVRTEPLNLDDDDEISVVKLDEENQTEESDDFTVLPKASHSMGEFRGRRPAAGTLVVCPASVVRQWARELDEKVTHEARLSVLVYHGGSRTKNPAALAGYDVVVTTYAIVTNEVPKRPLVEEDDDEQKDGARYGLSSEFSMNKKTKKSSVKKSRKKGGKEIDVSAFDSDCGTLARVKWSRVILDEAQTIKNHRTQVARACCSLRAKRRWCLSGTPIQNSIDEVFSYFRFLRYQPYDKLKSFGTSIKFPISRNAVHGYKKLQVILRQIMLRRTKGTLIDREPIITLPPKTIHLTRVDFSAEERAFYNRLEADSRSQFKAYAAAGTVNQNYANILLLLLRLRQACDHPLLVKGLSSDPVGKVSSDMAKRLPKELLVNLLRLLETSLAICLVCRDPPENAVVTMCGHVFCYQCVSEFLTGEDSTCPAPECKEQLGADVVYSKPTLWRCISSDTDNDVPVSSEGDEKCMVLHNEYISSKIKAVLEILRTHCKPKNQSPELYGFVSCSSDASSSGKGYLDSDTEGPEKAIVFSQWTGMLDLVEMSLKDSCLNYRRLDGTMSLGARDRAVKDFNTIPEVSVMLMSLKAGNLGLNMVAACRVILLDLWWNPATEDQAIDRAHRIGQTRAVTVSRLTIKDTVEDRILSLQEDKRKMIASAFGDDQSGGTATRLTVEDLTFLFEVSDQSRRNKDKSSEHFQRGSI
ncbi:SNF2 domain-containing protein/helicase domain-containing protein/zinc finger protein-related [Abeliophyllum distichum]|uniref:SNF2 domain-containing protein/helicase domain-containing protein/zinc finger protein-related n=1 Tax=Abeliophyllum distichum TaxID=126358 RepID=A0ABD1VVF8_9LAMI